jgi:hypothetical protein
MQAFDQLFIRACKSENPFKRLKSLRRRFYLERDNSDHDFYWWVVEIGMEVIGRTTGFCVNRFRECERNNSAVLKLRFHPEEFEGWSFEQRRNYVNAHAIRLFLAHIQKDELKKIGYVSPAMFRVKEKNKWRLTTRYEYVGY